jgi:hypothetical protein
MTEQRPFYLAISSMHIPTSRHVKTHKNVKTDNKRMPLTSVAERRPFYHAVSSMHIPTAKHAKATTHVDTANTSTTSTSVSTQEQLSAPPLPTKAPPTRSTDLQPNVLPVPGTFAFRKAVIETESVEELSEGIVCGQACLIDLMSENPSLTSKHLARLFIEIMCSNEPEAFNVGFLMSLVDALLRARKTYPHGW